MTAPRYVRIAAGRVPFYCHACGDVVATIAEAKLQMAAALTPHRGKGSDKLAAMITDAAAVKCIACESSLVGTDSGNTRG